MRLSTKELFEIYYSNMSSTKEKKTRGQIDRDELYDYEDELGKSLLDFDPEECFQLLIRFQNENKYSVSYEFSYQSFMMHQCALKDFFNWYIENYEVIRNPFLNSFFTKYDVIQEKLSRSRTVFTTKKMEEIIEFFYRNYDGVRATYLDMVVRLFYAGFSEEAELAAVTPDMIDYENKVIELPSGKNISLSDKLVELMKKIDATSYIEDSYGKTYALTRSGKRWFKYVINPSNLKSLNEKSIQGLAKNIAQIMEVYIRQPLNIKINTRTLYLLGVYDRICEEIGPDEAYKMIVGNRNKESTRIIMKVANLSNPSDYNVTNLKRDMKLFIDFVKYDPKNVD